MINEIKNKIRDVNDFPSKGIVFKDITPILSQPKMCSFIMDKIYERIKGHNIDAVAGIESRGFLFGMGIAERLNVAFIPIRKKGKLPSDKVSIDYDLEYGKSSIEIHKDALSSYKNIHIHDDLIATGGTAGASAELISTYSNVSSFSFIIELEALEGRRKLQRYGEIESMIRF